MTETRRPPAHDLATYVRELTTHHRHAEHYTIRVGQEWAGRNHTITAPPLLQQLWDNDIPSNTTEDGPRPGYASRPAARLDALDTATRIDIEASRWVRLLGEDDPGSTLACVRRVHALAASVDAETRRAIERDVRRWWTWARIVTGWDSPPWTPDNTCPVCGERGTLKVRLADRIGACTNDVCRATWGEQSIGLLADHIRVESMAERAPRRGPGPCHCPLPRPVLPERSRLDFLCPRCGSASCTNALQRRLVETLRASVADGRIGA